MAKLKHDPSEYIRGIQQILISDKKKIGFLFGAGSSLAYKSDKSLTVPAIGKMTSEIVEEVGKGNKKYKEAFVQIKEELGNDNFNIETILSNLEQKYTFIGKGTLNKLDQKEFADLIQKVKTEVRKKVSVHKNKEDKIVTKNVVSELVQTDFANWIGQAERKFPIEIFTTNYDFLFELGLEHKEIPYYDGFCGSLRAFFNPESVEDFRFLPKQTKLWKIHGSLGWHFDKDTEKILRVSPDDDDILIYPSTLKYKDSKKQPYESLLDRLSNFLKQDDAILITCGYSWGDEHINSRIISALKTNTTSHVIGLIFDKFDPINEQSKVSKIGLDNPKISIYASRNAIIGSNFGEWRFKTYPNAEDDTDLYFNPDNGEDDKWTGNGEFILPEFGRLVTFLNSMVSDNEIKKLGENVKNKITEIGEIDSISGNSISVKLFDNIKSSMPIIDGVVYRVGQIGSFVRIPLGYANLYGIVTQIGSAAIPESLREAVAKDYDHLKDTRWINIVLAGEQVGKRFERGVTQYPTTGDKVHLVTINDLDIIYGGYEEANSITVGNISVSESLDAKIDLDKLISRHCAIVGSTGSGKSNSVSVLLQSIASREFPSSRILVIDPHGEYNDALSKYSKVIEVNSADDDNKLQIPFWALPFNELMNIFSGNLTDQNREYIREKVVEAKIKSAEENEIEVAKESITADSPIPFSIKRLWFELDDFERKTFQADRVTVTAKAAEGDIETLKSNEYPLAGLGNSAPFLNQKAKGLLSFLDSMRNKLNDSSYGFLFSPGKLTPDSDGKIEEDLDAMFLKWLGNGLPITILDLSGIPSEIMSSISGTLLKIIYDGLFWGVNTKVGGKNQPLLIVLEEAHSYLKAGEHSISSRIVQMIAKEGRKYGVGLLLVTQRPSELDETVLSQCGTMIALRMNNSKDRGHIRSAVQDELQSMVDLLPSLRTGEALISGEAVKIPSRVKFFKIANAPKSSDPKASEKWLETINDAQNEYKKLLKSWRNKNYKI